MKKTFTISIDFRDANYPGDERLEHDIAAAVETLLRYSAISRTEKFHKVSVRLNSKQRRAA